MKAKLSHTINMNHLKISILVPVYGAEKYISRCVRSLFGQTYDNIEFVFVNDCTPDRSIEILKSVLKDYPQRQSQARIISHDKNRGVAATRNTLLDNATGDYILWVDADDFIELRTAETLAYEAAKNKADIICFGAIKHTKRWDKSVNNNFTDDKKEFIRKILEGKISSVLWDKMFKLSMIADNNIRFVPGVEIGEDAIFIIKTVWAPHRIIQINENLYHYDATNNSSITHAYSERNKNAELEYVQQVETFLNDKIDVEEILDVIRINARLSQMYNACRIDDRNFYEEAKSAYRAIRQKNVKPTKSKLYLFFAVCNIFVINRIWAWILCMIKRLYGSRLR
mgnify:CR=1 FL=1